MKKYVGGGVKDERGIFLPPSGKKEECLAPPLPDIPEPGTLDEIGEVIILSLARATKRLLLKISADDVSREVIGALKDCEAMHRELSKKEKEYLASLSIEDLEKLAGASFQAP